MAITFDSATNSSGVTTGGSVAHTCTGSKGILFVGVVGNTLTNSISGLTYAGVAMTLADTGVHYVGGGQYVTLWYLVNPASGNNNVILTAASGIYDLDIVSYAGAAQTGQPDNHTNSTTGVSSTTFGTTLTTNADNCWAVLIVTTDHGTVITTASATLRTNSSSNVGIYDNNGPVTPAGSLTMTAQTGTAGGWGTVMASFSPFVAAPVNGNFLAFFT
jgi:hypothetical protein